MFPNIVFHLCLKFSPFDELQGLLSNVHREVCLQFLFEYAMYICKFKVQVCGIGQLRASDLLMPET